MALLYGRAERVTVQNGGLRPTQWLKQVVVGPDRVPLHRHRVPCTRYIRFTAAMKHQVTPAELAAGEAGGRVTAE